MSVSEWMTSGQVRDALGVSRTWVRRLAEQGEFTVRTVQRGSRLDRLYLRETVELYKAIHQGTHSDEAVESDPIPENLSPSEVGFGEDHAAIQDLRGRVTALERTLATTDARLRQWQDAWTKQRQYAETRRAADAARSKAIMGLVDSLKNLQEVDDLRLKEIYEMQDDLAAALFPDDVGGVGL